MADDSGIDPRYAAQFQRGFDPAEHAPPPSRRGPVRLEGGPPPRAPRVPDPPPLVEHPSAVEPDEQPVHDAEEHAPAHPRSEWALLGVAVAIFAASALLFSRWVELSAQYQGPGPDIVDQLIALAASQLPGPLLVAGTLAICLWIVLRAVSARRRTP